MRMLLSRLFLVVLLLSLSVAYGAEKTTTKSSSSSNKESASSKTKESSSSKSKESSTPAKKENSEKSSEKSNSKTTAKETPKPDAKMVIIKADKVSLREKPKKDADALDTLVRFTPVQVIGTDGEWSRVRTKEGATGWIYTSYLARHAYVSVGATVAPMRQGPNSEDPILWKVNKNWPLQVIERTEHWAKVRDCDGSEGWIHESNLATDNYVVVKTPTMNLREGPGADPNGNPKAAKRFAAQKGVIFLVLDAKEGWLKLRHKDGDEGWAGAKQVWGWE